MKKEILVDTLTALTPSKEDAQTLANTLTEKTGIKFSVETDFGLRIISVTIDVKTKLNDDTDFNQYVTTHLADSQDQSSIPNFFRTNLIDLYGAFLSELTGASFRYHLDRPCRITLSVSDPAMIKALVTNNQRLLSPKLDYDSLVSFLNAISKDLGINWTRQNRSIIAETLDKAVNKSDVAKIKAKITQVLPFPSLTTEPNPFYISHDEKITCHI